MPRAGLDRAKVVGAAAMLADAEGFDAVTIAAVAERLGVRGPALYKHVTDLADLRRGIATVAMDELGDALLEAIGGLAEADALTAAFRTIHRYVTDHPGRYRATVGERLEDPDDPLVVAAGRVMGSLRGVLTGYGLPAEDLDHAIRTVRCLVHGYAVLQADGGFRWDLDPEDTITWMIGFLDRGLSATA